jgi:spore coat polysaccharide biosynthesis protein SpsF
MSKNRKSAQLVLGTAQLGLDGATAAREAQLVLQASFHAGISWIETSPAFGAAEQRIGRALPRASGQRIATRLSRLDPSGIREAVTASVRGSCTRLNTSRLDVVVLESASQLAAFEGQLWRALRELRDEGTIYELGMPVASPEEALAAIAEPDIRYIQLQFNALDWRWRDSGVIDALAARPDITVHAHSALMQGLLAATPGVRWPAVGSIDPEALRQSLWALAADLGRDCPADLCIAYVRAQPWIHGVIAGARNPSQLALNLARFRRPALTTEEVRLVNAVLPRAAGEALAAPARARAA